MGLPEAVVIKTIDDIPDVYLRLMAGLMLSLDGAKVGDCPVCLENGRDVQLENRTNEQLAFTDKQELRCLICSFAVATCAVHAARHATQPSETSEFRNELNRQNTTCKELIIQHVKGLTKKVAFSGT